MIHHVRYGGTSHCIMSDEEVQHTAAFQPFIGHHIGPCHTRTHTPCILADLVVYHTATLHICGSVTLYILKSGGASHCTTTSLMVHNHCTTPHLQVPQKRWNIAVDTIKPHVTSHCTTCTSDGASHCTFIHLLVRHIAPCQIWLCCTLHHIASCCV